MISTTLSHIAAVLGGRLVLHGGDTPDTTVDGLVDTDSRLIEPGGVFVAKPGETTDGHLFVPAAI
ncbi:UDP-N-acetylmuramoyl-tripeptide--D-alanyl-D-alanine ligase, partial [Vibrio parahaemolyticus]